MAKNVPFTAAQIALLSQVPALQQSVNTLQADAGGQTVDQLSSATAIADSDKIYLRQGASPNYIDSSAAASQIRDYINFGFNENVDDRVAALIVNDSGLTKSYDDTGNLLHLGIDPAAVGGVFKLPLSSSSPISANYSMISADAGSVLSVATAATDVTLTLLTSGIVVGTTIAAAKNDNGTGKVILTDGTNALAWLPQQYDFVLFRWNGTSWRLVSKAITPWFQQITTTQTITVPPLSTIVELAVYGPGGSGASGRRGAAASIRYGGGGGSRGGLTMRRLRTALLGTSVLCTIGASGTPGVSITTDSTNGTSGAAGTDTTFGTFVRAGAGSPGNAGTATSGPGGAGVIVEFGLVGGGAAGGNSSTTGTPASGAVDVIGNAGAGGGIDASDVSRPGGAGKGGSSSSYTPLASTTGGVAGSTTTAGGNGGAGASVTDPINQYGGSGGAGGGGGGSGSVAGTGAAGGFPGGGGGGGGAAFNGFASGAGGIGGAGVINLFWIF